jgi:hypothetical protein
MEQLITLRNAALLLFKQSCHASDWHTKTEAARNLFTALDAVDALYRRRHLSLHIGAEDAEFQVASADLIGVLVDYFTNYSLDKALPAALTTAQTHYRAQERAFLDDNQADFIKNFWLIAHGGNLHDAFDRLQIIHAGHSLLLSDEALRAWRLESLHLTPEGLLVNEITPYYVNRILLQAFLVPFSEWTEAYANYLVEITEWLLQPATLGGGLVNSFRSSYPQVLLADLHCLALAARNPHMDADRKARLVEHPLSYIRMKDLHHLPALIGELGQDFFDTVKDRLQILIRGVGLLGFVLNHHGVEAYRTQILNALQDRLPMLIGDGFQLGKLLSAPYLTEAHRTQILNAVQDRLPMLIDDGENLAYLLGMYGLTNAHRTQIWNAVQDKLSMLLGDARQLVVLLQVSQLTDAKRTRILEAKHDRLPMFIHNGHQLVGLLGIYVLTEAHRTQILNALQDRLPMLIGDVKHLADLFCLPYLTEAHRAQILNACQDSFHWLIGDGHELANLLCFPQLTVAHRRQVLNAMDEKKLTTALDSPHLTKMQKSMIQNVLQSKFSKASKEAAEPKPSGYSPKLFPTLSEETREIEAANNSDHEGPN